jgi:superfamily II RNA helicase
MNIYDLSSVINNEDELQQKYKSSFQIDKDDFKFDKFQLISFREIDSLYNVLVSAPTSSGKTAVAEYGLISTIKKGKKVIYTSPIKSLSNEKYKEFKDRNICSVGLLTGDNKINVDADCVIMTAEILRNSLYKKDQLSDDIGCVIMDEVHFINDPDRGKIWEETIIMLPQHVQIIMLSATINNVEQFAKWINSVRENNLSLIKSSRRIVPLNYYIYSNELYKILDNNDTFDDLTYFESKRKYEKIKKDRLQNHKSPVDPSYFDKIVKFLIKNDLLQAIFFSFSRLNCEKYANTISPILTSEESTNAINMFDFLMRKYHKDYEFIPQYIQVRNLIQRGICFHHSGLIPIIKEIIEILFRDGFIKVLFATETFAVGVNMPTRTVVFTELTKPTNMTKRFLNTAEFKQMSGRAGRRGKDVIGHVILLPYYEFPELQDLKSVMLQSMPSITSKFSIDYYYSLKTIDMKENIYDKSLLNSEQLDNILSDQDNLNKLTGILNEYKTFSDSDISNFEKQYKLDNFNSQNTFLKLSKSQEKELKILKQNNQDDYKLYFEKNTLVKKISSLKQQIEDTKLYCDSIHKIVTNILIDEGYIKFKESDMILDAFGVAVIQCNECNGILITEMIKNNIFDNMDGNDIIAFLSIFASYKNNGFKSEYYVSEYNKVLEIVDKWTSYEIKHQMNICSEEFWEITNGYIDIVYDWITLDVEDNKNMGQIITQLQTMNEYEGNFVKNMLKIYNVCVCVKAIFELLNKPDLVVKLDNLDQKILKNIVNVNSLYLS